MQVTVRSEGDVLHNTLDLLQDGEKWIKGLYEDYKGTSYCLLGAMRKTGGPDPIWERAHERLYKVVRARGYGSIPGFNDSRVTEWEDVEEVVNEAIASFEPPRTLSGEKGALR